MARFLAHLALLVVALVYGGNYLVAKGLMPNLIGPSGFIVLRVLGGGGLFWFVRAVIRYQQGTWERIERADFFAVARLRYRRRLRPISCYFSMD